MNNASKYLLVGSGLSLLLLTGATMSAHAATSTTEPSVIVFDQKIANASLTLDYAYLPTKGYAVVYSSDKSGNPTFEPVGHAELNAGDHRQVKIKLSNDPPKGSKLWVSIYSDKDNKSGFNKTSDASVWGKTLPLENQMIVQ